MGKLNNKAFTLTELIITIAIIAILAIIAFPAIASMQGNNDQTAIEEHTRLMTEAARIYVDRRERDLFASGNNCVKIHETYLVKQDLIRELDIRGVECSELAIVAVREGSRITYYRRINCTRGGQKIEMETSSRDCSQAY